MANGYPVPHTSQPSGCPGSVFLNGFLGLNCNSYDTEPPDPNGPADSDGGGSGEMGDFNSPDPNDGLPA